MINNSKQFGRVCKLVIGAGGTGIEINHLRIIFDVRKTSGGDPNTAKIQIYNLNADNTTRVIEEWQEIQLIAGYEGAERLIFTGQIRTALPRISGADRILNIEAGDGDREVLRGFINKTVEKGCSAEDVIDECQKAMFSVPAAHRDMLNNTYQRGRVLSGRASDLLTKQCMADDAQWSIQNGELLVLKGGNTLPNAVWLINQDTGMLGSPEPTTIGVKVKTLLNPAYLIGGVAKIDSQVFGGGVRIESINHRGDTHGDDWASEIEGLNV